MLCFRCISDLHVVVSVPNCVTFAAFDSFENTDPRRRAEVLPNFLVSYPCPTLD
jgi:hypothetical protein